MMVWRGQEDNVADAQIAFLKRAEMNSLAISGAYDAALEKIDDSEDGENQAVA